MNMLARYLKERENVDSVQSDFGFATYIVTGKECYIRDIWVDPRFRQLNEASKLADEIVKVAKARGCTILSGTVAPHANEATTSLKVLLGYGMQLVSASENLIVFKKDIGE